MKRFFDYDNGFGMQYQCTVVFDNSLKIVDLEIETPDGDDASDKLYQEISAYCYNNLNEFEG